MKKLLLFFFFSCLAGQALANALVSQHQWRWRHDDGDETSATWQGAVNQKLVVHPGSAPVRLRMQFNSEGSNAPFAHYVQENLSYSTSPGGAFTRIPIKTNPDELPFLLVSSSQVASGTATTRQLSAGPEIFQPGLVLPLAGTSAGNITFPEPNPATIVTEYEWVLQPTSFVQPGTYYFKLEDLNAAVPYPVALPEMEVVAINISGQPEAATVTGGANTSFTVAATAGSSALAYQWQQSRDGGSTFTDIPDGGVYSGATTATLAISRTPISLNDYQYRVVLSNGSTLYSAAAGLTVAMPAFDLTRTWLPGGTPGFSAGGVEYVSQALDADGRPYVAYRDAATGNKVTVMTFNGTAWETVGTPGFSADQADYISLALDAAGRPYVAYRDAATGYKTTVKKFNGTAWETVGTPTVSAGIANYISLVLDAAGTPYVAYGDAAAGQKATVKKFNGTAWETVGTPGFSSANVLFISLALDAAGMPYLAYSDAAAGFKATVMRFNGTAWETVGAPGFTAADSYYNSLALDAAGTPYLAYMNAGMDGKAMVMTFNGTAWETVGGPGFSADEASYISMALDAAGTPYVAYRDQGNSFKATVKKFNGTAWETVGTAGLSAGMADYISLALDAAGTPFLAYQDAGNGNKATVMKLAPAVAVTSVSVPVNGTYKPGDALTFTVNYSDNLTVNTAGGSPSLGLSLGAASRSAAYESGSGSAALVFGYTVQAGDLDADGITLGSISLQGAIIRNDAGAHANNTLVNAGATSGILVDGQAPQLSLVSIASNNADAAKAKAGEVVTLSFTASEAIAPTATIAGKAATVTAVSATEFTAAYTLSGSDAEGAIAFSISFSDAVGNTGTAVSATTNGSSVSFDKTAPSVLISSAITNLTNVSPIPFSITFSEAVTGLVAADFTTVNGSVGDLQSADNISFTASFTPVADGPVSVALAADKAADAAGNGNTASASLSSTFDSVAPVGYTLAFNQPQVNAANQQAVSLQVSGAEAGAVYFYRITGEAGGAPITGTATAAAANFELAGLDVSELPDGRLTATFYQRDAAGNQGPETSASVSKVMRNIIAFTPVADVVVPIRTILANVSLPALVEVTYTDQTRQQIPVSWSAGTFDGLVAGTYELSGVLRPAAGTANKDNVVAKVRVVVEPNKAPTGLALSQASFKPEITATEAIGILSATDADDSQHSYSLVSGTGSSDNALFEVRGNQLFLRSNKDLSGITSFSVRVRVTDPYHNAFEQAFPLSKQAYAKAAADLKIVNTFSPNGDGLNETWVIPELRFYNEVEVEIFDRNGKRQFHSTKPGLGWDGKADSGLELKGAVLYIVRIKDINLVKKGVVTILRN